MSASSVRTISAEALMLAKVDVLDVPDDFGSDRFQNIITDLPIIKKEIAGAG